MYLGSGKAGMELKFGPPTLATFGIGEKVLELGNASPVVSSLNGLLLRVEKWRGKRRLIVENY